MPYCIEYRKPRSKKYQTVGIAPAEEKVGLVIFEHEWQAFADELRASGRKPEELGSEAVCAALRARFRVRAWRYRTRII